MSISESEDFKINRNPASVNIDREQNLLKWTCFEQKKQPLREKCICLADIITTSCAGTQWTVTYVDKSQTQWSVESVTFTGQEGNCQNWSHDIEQELLQQGIDRPKNVTVFINPKSGKGNSVKEYDKIVRPLFEMAEINTTVIVTDDEDHAQRVLKNSDLTSIDSVVSVGGDGSFMRVVNAVFRKLMMDEGYDLNDVTGPLVRPNIRFGMIPGGTANMMTKIITGLENPDITTAALHIILGFEITGNMLSVYHNNQLVTYGTMSASYGFYGDVAVTAERKRSMGIFRLVYAFFRHLTKPRQFDISFSLLPDGNNVQSSDWETITGRYLMLNTFIFRMPSRGTTLSDAWQGAPALVFTMDASAGSLGLIKHFINFSRLKPEAFDYPFINKYDTKAVKFDIPASSENSSLSHMINVDGEPITLSEGEVVIRLHKNAVRVFGGCTMGDV